MRVLSFQQEAFLDYLGAVAYGDTILLHKAMHEGINENGERTQRSIVEYVVKHRKQPSDEKWKRYWELKKAQHFAEYNWHGLSGWQRFWKHLSGKGLAYEIQQSIRAEKAKRAGI